jgi:hypothetical protein
MSHAAVPPKPRRDGRPRMTQGTKPSCSQYPHGMVTYYIYIIPYHTIPQHHIITISYLEPYIIYLGCNIHMYIVDTIYLYVYIYKHPHHRWCLVGTTTWPQQCSMPQQKRSQQAARYDDRVVRRGVTLQAVPIEQPRTASRCRGQDQVCGCLH